MNSVNKAILIGFVGNDPEVRYVTQGVAYAKFPLATNESYLNKNKEKVTVTEWHNIVLWRSDAEFAEKYIKKGSLIYVEGKIRYRNWSDAEGNQKYSTDIYGTSVQLLGRKNGESEATMKNGQDVEPQTLRQFEVDEHDNLPF